MPKDRRAQIPAHPHGRAGAEVHRADGAHHLQCGHPEHHRAELDDAAQIALGHAVVDDRGIDGRQIQRRQRADDLQRRHRGEQLAVRLDVPSQQSPEHPATVAHRRRRERVRLLHLRIA